MDDSYVLVHVIRVRLNQSNNFLLEHVFSLLEDNSFEMNLYFVGTPVFFSKLFLIFFQL